MTRYEYRLIQAPTEPPKIKGVRGAVPRYLQGLTEAMNEMGAEGWSYVRTDRLPVSSRKGLLRRLDVHEELVMVFRRAVAEAAVPADPPVPAADAAPRAVQPPVRARPDHWPESPAPEEFEEHADPAVPPPEMPSEMPSDTPPETLPEPEAPRLAGRSGGPFDPEGRGMPRLFSDGGGFASRRGEGGPRLTARRDGES